MASILAIDAQGNIPEVFYSIVASYTVDMIYGFCWPFSIIQRPNKDMNVDGTVNAGSFSEGYHFVIAGVFFYLSPSFIEDPTIKTATFWFVPE